MHEYPLTRRIIETAERYACENKAEKVEEIQLVIGDNAGCCAESIELYFDLIAEGTLCSSAKLTVERVRSMLRCKKCGVLFERTPFCFECVCGGDGEPTEIGREFYLKSILIREENWLEKNRNNGINL